MRGYPSQKVPTCSGNLHAWLPVGLDDHRALISQLVDTPLDGLDHRKHLLVIRTSQRYMP